MGKKSDKELLQDILKIYFEATSSSEFTKELKKYIKNNKITKTESYLKDLITQAKKKNTKGTILYEMICNTQEIYRNESNYKTIVTKLLQMTDEELEEYIKNNDIKRIKIKFEKYIKKINEKEKIETAKKTLERIKKIHQAIKDSAILKNEKQKYDKAIMIFDTMINKGFFDYIDFITRMNKYFDYDLIEMERVVSNSIVLLKTKYPEKMQEYENKIEKNKIRFYILHQQQIKNMIIGIKHGNYDIIDFYTDFKLSCKVFQKLYYELTKKKIIKIEDKIMLNKFFQKYNERIHIEHPKNSFGRLIECNGIITQEEENIIKSFMEQYGIPSKHFKLCYKKYKKGELKNCFGRQLIKSIPIN